MDNIKLYRKKPVVIEAFKLIATDDVMDILMNAPSWLHCEHVVGFVPKESDWYHLRIITLEGTMIAEPNDYIIKGIKGEIYPCKPDIFEATYEEIKPDTITTEVCGACLK